MKIDTADVPSQRAEVTKHHWGVKQNIKVWVIKSMGVDLYCACGMVNLPAGWVFINHPASCLNADAAEMSRTGKNSIRILNDTVSFA